MFNSDYVALLLILAPVTAAVRAVHCGVCISRLPCSTSPTLPINRLITSLSLSSLITVDLLSNFELLSV